MATGHETSASSSSFAPLAPVSLILQSRYLDETGELRHVHGSCGMFAYATAADRYTAMFHVADPTHRRWYDLTGEHGFSLALCVQLGVGGAAAQVTLAASASLSPTDVRGLVESALRKTDPALVHTFPGFACFGLPEDRVDAIIFTVVLARTGRSVCVSKIEAKIPPGDALRIAERLVLHKAQINAPTGCGGQ